MSFFTSSLKVERVDNFADDVDGRWRLLAPLGYQSDIAGELIIVHAGFETDFASVPRLPFVFMAFGERGEHAATVHDWLYTTRYRDDRELCDDIFLEALRVQGISQTDAEMMYIGVRIGGEAYWRS